jgi:hypothetical protein
MACMDLLFLGNRARCINELGVYSFMLLPIIIMTCFVAFSQDLAGLLQSVVDAAVGDTDTQDL